ncbi:unnamed protein product [Fraxinus pennsylvanica]|uniref:Uncharacterized protein n=1 Tax=Fraxinus pennsylvanica TaxID=56036 RepID=A0AAD2A4M4_9LAMI|nr:unnamed protein product [Fraxinus pennsylvanica]
MAMAFWKSERSSSSSGTEIEICRDERILGAKKKNKIGNDRRRIRVGISGEDVEQAMAMNLLFLFCSKLKLLEHQTVTETRLLQCRVSKKGESERRFHIWRLRR